MAKHFAPWEEQQQEPCMKLNRCRKHDKDGILCGQCDVELLQESDCTQCGDCYTKAEHDNKGTPAGPGASTEVQQQEPRVKVRRRRKRVKGGLICGQCCVELFQESGCTQCGECYVKVEDINSDTPAGPDARRSIVVE